jgi:hypothetical protein
MKNHNLFIARKLKYIRYFLLCFLLFPISSFAQDDLMDLFEEEPATEYTSATFKTTRIALGHSIENPANGDLLFLISHHFGKISSGAYEFLDWIKLPSDWGLNTVLMTDLL